MRTVRFVQIIHGMGSSELLAVHIRTHELNVVPLFTKFGGPKKSEGILTPEGSCDTIYTDNLYVKSY